MGNRPQNFQEDLSGDLKLGLINKSKRPPLTVIDPDELDTSYSLNVPLKKSLKDTDSLENTLKKIFENSKIILSERGSIEDSKEVAISKTDGDDEFIGVVFEDDNDSCSFSMPILDFDL